MAKKQNKTSVNNKASINQAIHQHLKKHNKMPTLCEISDNTGLSRQAVARHLKDLKLPEYLHKYRELTDDVMMCLLRACEAGNIHAMKLYFQLTWRWKIPRHNDDTSDENPNRISQVIISQAKQKKTIDIEVEKIPKHNIEKSSKNENDDALEYPPFSDGWPTF